MNQIDTRPFGERLRHFRERAALTQVELAERAGLSAEAISALERGVRRRAYPQTLRVLAEALALSAAERVMLGVPPLLTPSEGHASDPVTRIHSNGQLPVATTPLIGREREEAAVASLLARPDIRLLTLTGPGGVGKTRLALEVAAGMRDRFDDVVFVPLAPLGDSRLVLTAIAQSLGMTHAGALNAAGLAATLRDRHLLLLLDNFEHVAAAAPLLAELLATAEPLTLLVTSRAALRLRGEHEYAVPPLPIPLPARALSLAELRAFPAVRLFDERARAVAPGFVLNDANAPAVAEICSRLDGLPLALELAAARIRVLTPEAMLSRMLSATTEASPLSLLRGGPQDAPPRHRTLRDAIAWSYDLLTDDDQTLFRRMAVFAGACSLEAAEGVNRAVQPPIADVLGGIESLIRNSLLRRVDVGGLPRFAMLATIREFAHERLISAAERELARTAHAQVFLDFAEQSEPHLRGPDQAVWLDGLETDIDNLREALHVFAEYRDAEKGLRLASALKWFWWDRGYLHEGQEWLTAFLDMPYSAVPLAVRAKAMNGASYFHSVRGDYDAAIALAEEALALHRRAGEREGAAWSLAYLAVAHYRRGDVSQSRSVAEESLAIFRQVGPPGGALFALGYAGLAAQDLEDDVAARALLEEGVALARQLGDRDDLSRCLLGLGFMALYNQDDAASAHPYIMESFAVSIALGQPPIYSLEGLASLAAAQNRPLRALRLAGAAAALREARNAKPSPLLRAKHERLLAVAWAALPDDAGRAAWSEGQAMTPEQLADYVAADAG